METPYSLNVTVGTVAEFNCSSTSSSLIWQVNGSDLGSVASTQSFTPEGGGFGTRLMIQAMSATTNTTVQCLVFTFQGTQNVIHFSNVAVLMVQGVY